MPGEALAAAQIAKLLSQVFGWVVEPTGWEQLTLDNKRKLLMRGVNEGIAKDDWVAVDGLFQQYRELRREIGG